MTVSNFVRSFNRVNADNRKSSAISFKLNGRTLDRSMAKYNEREVKSFIAAPYSDGSMMVEIFTD